MFDDHLHTCFSGDSDASVESMVEAAVEKGLTSICVTDHQDPDFPPCDISFDLDTEADAIEAAVSAVLKEDVRTADIMSEGCKKAGCQEMGRLIAEHIG